MCIRDSYNIKAKELKKISKNGIVQMDIQLSPENYSIAFNQDVLGSMLTGSMSVSYTHLTNSLDWSRVARGNLAIRSSGSG